MEPKKDKWINDVLGSIDGMNRAEPGPFLYAKIQHRLKVTDTTQRVPARMVWLAIASFALLVLLNWRITNRFAKDTPSGKPALNTVISEMQLYPDSNQPYELWSGQNF
ncbi:hypothetical protein WBJ53_25780 [Spirosoma sp. SC4-14]|uniref:hypothetical protein n=1 Tax=Spirosoma sp. SC4-14 TaxID=3128900 RepID=UPI0030CD0F6F